MCLKSCCCRVLVIIVVGLRSVVCVWVGVQGGGGGVHCYLKAAAVWCLLFSVREIVRSLEDTIGSYACWFDASWVYSDNMLLGRPLFYSHPSVLLICWHCNTRALGLASITSILLRVPSTWCRLVDGAAALV
jgi:hypothetical protein